MPRMILFLIGRKLFQVIVPEILPMIIRGTVGGEGECYLVLIFKHLHEDVVAVGLVAIEDELQVCGHR